jgi:hypothetical protein
MIALAVLGAPFAPAAPDLGLGDNESLTYHVSWAILPGVGSITVNARNATDPTGQPLLRVVTHTATRGLAWLILPFEAEAESLFDRKDDRLVWFGESSTTRARHRAHTVTFDYRRGRAAYVDGDEPAKTRAFPMPPGYPMDLITCLLHARTWNLRPGGARDALVLFEDEFYPVTVHATAYEDITTPLGNFHTLVLEPRMDKSPPKGMFKRGSTVRIWIAQDARRLPVRFQVHFTFGESVATLSGYRPPAAPK